jgi:hypothetical protein
MPWKIYDYVHPTKGNLMKHWASKLQKEQRVKLDFKVDALEQHGMDLIPNVVAPTRVRLIFKLRVKGNVQLRPLLCAGPGDAESFTFLLGAKEIQSHFDPPGAPDIAAIYRNDLIVNPQRRELHERTNRKSKK